MTPPFGLRRAHLHHAEPTQPLVVFRVQQEWFALPAHVTRKVIPIHRTDHAPQSTDMSLAFYQDQEVLVIETEFRIFGAVSQQKLLPSTRLRSQLQSPDDLEQQRYLLIVQTQQGSLMGLTLDSQPRLRRVPESAFSSLPSLYETIGPVACISAVIRPSQDESPIFLLDLNQLFQSQPVHLPPKVSG